jgi:hypothetical protein
MKLYKLGVLLMFMVGITTRSMQIILDEFSLVPFIHLVISIVLLSLLLVKKPFVKSIYKWFFFIQYLTGILGILSFLILYLLRDNYDDFAKLYLHIYHAILGGILFHNCDKYFVIDEPIEL